MSKKRIRFISIFCALAIAFSSFSVSVSAETLEEKYARLQEEIKTISSEIESAKDSEAAAVTRQANLVAQKKLLEDAIATKKELITQTETDLAAKEDEIAQTRQVILENDTLFQERLVALYKMNNSNAIVQMLSVDNLADFITVTDSMKRISQHDTDLLNNLQAQRELLETQQAEIDASLSQIEADKADLERDTASLANSIVQANSAITAAQAAQESGQAELEETKAAALKASQEMEAAAKAAAAKGSQKGDGSTYSGGLMQWPAPNHSTITCYFGAPDPGGVAHRGMDISGNHRTGDPIVAAADGKVITAGWHNSYGNYVVIDHGGAIQTLYGHCSALYVSAGDTVSKGDTIAAIGSTGYSTGPHLHFEVRVSGTAVDPLPYLRG